MNVDWKLDNGVIRTIKINNCPICGLNLICINIDNFECQIKNSSIFPKNTPHYFIRRLSTAPQNIEEVFGFNKLLIYNITDRNNKEYCTIFDGDVKNITQIELDFHINFDSIKELNREQTLEKIKMYKLFS